MTNTRRNTLVLSALFVLLAGGAFSLFQNLNKKAEALKEENKKTEGKIAVLESQISNIDSLRYEYELRKAMVAEQSKVILAHDTPTITYQYLLRILSWMERNINFDFAVAEKGKIEATWNEYVVSGRSDYRNVYSFTKYIEHQRTVLTVEELSIGSDGQANSDTVSFSMVLRTHFQEGGIEAKDIKPKKIPVLSNFYQLFKSRVYETPPDDSKIDPTLVVIDQCQLIGIANNRIFLRDSQGIIRILAVRDKVAHGYLYAIDSKQGKAIFMIDKHGLPEEQTLYLITIK